MATNLQTFSGEVEIPEGNLQLKRILELSGNNASTSNTGILFSRNLGSTSNSNVIVYFDEATESLRFGHTLNASSDSEIIMDSANVLNVNVFGEVEASYFKGDGGLLSNLVTDLQSVTENGAETDQTLVLTNAVTGIDVQTGNVNVAGNVTASIFFGDGGLLSNITQTLQGITEIGNTTSIGLEFNNVTTGFVTTSNVGIVNTAPQHNFSVGSNLYVHDTASNVLTVEGNVSAHKLTLGQIEITPAYGLENVTNISNLAYDTLLFQNASTAFVTTAMAGIGLQPDSSDVGTSGLHVDGHLRLGGPAGTDENSDIYLRTAGQLNIESNDTDTDNQYTALALRAGNANESNIIVEGALSDTSKQYISFGVRNQERMKIDREGNVTVGYASTTHKLDVAGSANVTTLNASNLVINTVSISVQYDLDQILENGNVSTNVITVGKCTVTDPTLAQTASNLVTWNASTKEFEDSGGLISNKLAIVSEQPPSALTGATTTVDGHGKYILASSTGTAYYAFDKSSTAWTSGATYDGSTGAYTGAVDLGGAQTVSGEYLTVEFPYKTTLRHVTILPGGTTASFPGTAYIYGTNDNGTTWTSLKNWSGVTPSSTSDIQTFAVNATTTYRKYALVVNATSDGSTTAQVGEWRLFTETFTVDAGVVSTTAASGLDVGYTEHPVEPMTDYHTHVEGHGTYEASASSYVTNHEPWEPYNKIRGDPRWITPTNLYNSDGTYAGSITTTDVGGVRYSGEWNQLKIPYATIVSSIDFYPTGTVLSRSPVAGVVLGSCDGEHWYKLTEFSGKTYTNNVATKIDVNATTPYQYYRIVVSNVGTSPADGRCELNEIYYFAEKPVTRMENVHISGDLSSETLQTGYIKWPRKSLKANESEGYVASASSVFSNASYYQPYHAFEDKGEYTSDPHPAWSSGVDSFALGLAQNSRTTGDDTFNHEWIQIQMPRRIQLAYFFISSRKNRDEYTAPKSGYMYASNDGVSWTKIHAFSGVTSYVDDQNVRFDVSSTTAYSYFRLAVTETAETGTTYKCVFINELQLFEAATGVGAAPTSAKLQVAGSLGMAKGSEFFAGDDVVMELPKHDRPLVKYPEVAMTADSSGGYSVVYSSRESASHAAYKAFNDLNEVNYTTSFTTDFNTFASGVAAVSRTTGSDTFNHEYIQLNLPKPIHLQEIDIYRRGPDADNTNQPKEGRVYGSNDGTTFDLLFTYSGLTYNGYTTPTKVQNPNTTKRFYNRYRFVITEIHDTTNRVSIGEMDFWGYEEGDTSVDVVHRSIPNTPGQQHLEVYWDANDSNSYSFADSSNVYDLSGSGVTGTITGNNGFDADYNAWVFDGSGDYISGTLPSSASGDWVHSMSMWFKADSFSTAYDSNTLFYGGGSSVTANNMTFLRVRGGDDPYIAYNDIGRVAQKFMTISTGVWYHVTGTYSGGGWSNAKLYINGSLAVEGEADTTPLTFTASSSFYVAKAINASNPSFNGSIANFRLFSKALNADQVRELYEYDAPRFGHRQNLVSLHKGNLGVGVAHPTSRFEVAGADGLQEYPPKAMTDYESYMEGHGVFRASASTDAYAHTGFAIWKAFNKVQGNEGWHSGEGYVYGEDTSPLSYITNAGGAVFDTANVYQQIGGINGQWLKLECPQSIMLDKIVLQARTSYTTQAPKDFTILGSNNDSDWDILQSYVGVTSSTTGVTHIVNANESYTYFALVVTRVQTTNTSDAVISEWRLFGTPAPSSLEDGHLTLGKALTLPRVSGHAAGAETPRAESLVVHYDTTVDSVVSGSTVVDISGYGLNGTLSNGAAYSSTERAFTFDGTDDYLYQSGISGWSDNISHTTSFWFKILSPSSGYAGGIYQIYNNVSTTNNYSAVALVTGSSGYVSFYHFSNDYQYDIALSAGIWYHMVTVYPGSPTTQKVYINGENVPLTSSSGISVGSNLVLGTSPKLSIGGDIGRNNYYTDGSISNFKIWNVALTAEEVAMEYALGRTGKALNLTDTALCLGGTVPRAQLDVRGSAMIDGGLVIKYKNSIEYARDGGIMLSRAGLGNATNKYSSQPIVLSGGDSGAIDGNIRGGAIWSQWGGAQYGIAMRGANVSDTYPYLQDPALFVTKDKVGIGVTNPTVGLALNSDRKMAWVNSAGYLAAPTTATDGGVGSRIMLWKDSGSVPYGFGMENGAIWYCSPALHKFYINTTHEASITTAGPVSTFTGQHRCTLGQVTNEDLVGRIVVAENNKYVKMNDGVETGSNAITINECLPVLTLSTKSNQKSCFGVVSSGEDPDGRQDKYGNFISHHVKEAGDTRYVINSVGEGAMWVTDINGSLESGDYITTSNVPGYGQKQDSEFLANYTVAKITMDCDFNPVTQPIQIIKKELANVNYWVKTTYSNVSLEEYSNLADENRTTEDETYYTKDVERKYTYKPTVTVTSEDPWDDVYIMPFATYAEWSNLEANVQNTYTLTYMQNDFDSTRYEKTTVSNVSGDDVWDTVDISPYISYDEWSNLEANVQNTFTITYMQSVTTTCTEEAFSNLTVEEQNTYTLVYTKTVTEEVSEPEGADEHTRTIYKKVERNETKTEPTEDTDEWVLDVRQELVNVLDEHGQIQWEDDPSGATEKAFKIRHLDASGAQTDEANAVHIAAFVGCTYHCG
jgi:hypothetical protein